MYGEITYNDSKSIHIKLIPFSIPPVYSQKVILCFNCSEICSTNVILPKGSGTSPQSDSILKLTKLKHTVCFTIQYKTGGGGG